MGLQSFEHGLERMVEGVFTRGSRSSIRPVELGRRLLREMDDHRSVDVKCRRIVPNLFSITVSPRDHAGFADACTKIDASDRVLSLTYSVMLFFHRL